MNKKQIIGVALAGAFLLSLGSSADAAMSCTPGVSVKETKKTSITLKVSCPQNGYANEKVKVLVSTTKVDTSKKTKQTFSTTLNAQGVANVKISGLDTGTKYTFTAKAKKRYSPVYGMSSKEVAEETKGADYDVEIDKISSVSENGATVRVVSNDLEKEVVDVQVAYKKKNDWTVKTYRVTLDTNGKGSAALTGLSNDKKYMVKVRIKKDEDSVYTRYSDEDDFTTDKN